MNLKSKSIYITYFIFSVALSSCGPSERYRFWELKQIPISDAQNKSKIASDLVKNIKALRYGGKNEQSIYLSVKLISKRAMSIEIRDGLVLIHEPVMGGSSPTEMKETQILVSNIKQILEMNGLKIQVRDYYPWVFDIA